MYTLTHAHETEERARKKSGGPDREREREGGKEGGRERKGKAVGVPNRKNVNAKPQKRSLFSAGHSSTAAKEGGSEWRTTAKTITEYTPAF